MFVKQTIRAVGYQIDLPLLQNNNIFIYVMEFPESQNLSTNNGRLLPMSKVKRYAHANYHIIKAFRGEQTLISKLNYSPF